MIISKYFKTRVSLANGIITCGSSLGTLALSLETQWLFNRFGLLSPFRIFGAVHLVLFACVAVFRPVKETASSPPSALKRIEFFDWAICKNRALLVYVTALSFVMLGYLVPYVHLVSSVSSWLFCRILVKT